MKQARLTSLIEASTNTLIGFAVSFGIWPMVAIITGFTYTSGQHWAIVIIFTISSVLRGYLVRRFFNSSIHTAAELFSKKIMSIKNKVVK